LLGPLPAGRAQDLDRSPLFEPSLLVEGRWFDFAPVTGGDDPAGGEIGGAGGRLALTLPLAFRIRPSSRLPIVWPFLHLDTSGSRTEDDLARYDLRGGSLSGGVLLASKAGNVYIFAGGVSVRSSRDAASESRPQGLGLALATHRFGNRFALIYGGVLTTSFGRPVPIPLAGFQWSPGGGFSLKALLPVALRAELRFSSAFAAHIGLGLTGEYGQVTFAGGETLEGELLDFGVTRLCAEAGMALRLGGPLSLELRGGSQLGGALQAREGKTIRRDTRFGAAPFAMLSIRYLLGRTIDPFIDLES
jgi:hypothetical protein